MVHKEISRVCHTVLCVPSPSLSIAGFPLSRHNAQRQGGQRVPLCVCACVCVVGSAHRAVTLMLMATRVWLHQCFVSHMPVSTGGGSAHHSQYLLVEAASYPPLLSTLSRFLLLLLLLLKTCSSTTPTYLHIYRKNNFKIPDCCFFMYTVAIFLH